MNHKNLIKSGSNKVEHSSILLSTSIAISKAVNYTSLLESLLIIIIEQVGAVRVMLLKFQYESLILEAEAQRTSKGVSIESVNREAQWDDLPKSLVNRAVQTKQPERTNMNQQNTFYVFDPYFERFSGCTALCLPAFSQNELIAIFYLEFGEQFEDEYQVMLSIFAALAAAAIAAARLKTDIDQMNQQRHKLERALHLANASLALGEQISRTGSWRWELNSNTLICSEEFCHIFDLDPRHRAISFVDFAAYIHPDDRKLVLDRIQYAVQMETAINVDYRIVKTDGSILYLTGQGCPVFEKNMLVDYVGTVNDVTARHASEKALRSAQDDLARVCRITTIGQFASSIAHEINQPLMSIATNAGAGLRWLHRSVPDLQQVSSSLQAIAAEGQRAGQIVQSLRTLTKNNRTSLNVVDMHDVLNGILAIARREIERRNVLLIIRLDAQVSYIRGDIVQLQQVMLNLIMNAIEAMNEVIGRQRVLTISTTTKDDEFITVEVKDTGPGISEEIKDRLFEAFFTTKKDGMGMGLAICHSIVDMHGGKLSAVSFQPVGSVFSFFIPLAKD